MAERNNNQVRKTNQKAVNQIYLCCPSDCRPTPSDLEEEEVMSMEG